MVVQFEFEQPFAVSEQEDKNVVTLQILDYHLFVRKSDELPVSPDLKLHVELPRIVERRLGEATQEAGSTANSAAKAELFIVLILRLFGTHSLNKILGYVRSLGLVIHMLLMVLAIPPIVTLFFQPLLEFTNFELIPSDWIYEQLFDYESFVFSEQAVNVGYESCYMIIAAGSIPLYFIALVITYIIASLFTKILANSQNCC